MSANDKKQVGAAGGGHQEIICRRQLSCRLAVVLSGGCQIEVQLDFDVHVRAPGECAVGVRRVWIGPGDTVI
jgi:hypothetical protein